MSSYTEAQWDAIVKTVQNLPHFSQEFIPCIRADLEKYAEYYLTEIKNGAKQKEKFKTDLRRWIACQKSLAKTSALIRSAITNELDGVREPSPSYKRQLLDLEIALLRLQGFVGGRADTDPPPPPWTPAIARRTFHVCILTVWTGLGGELKFSRNPKVAGPLARYFAAVTTPIHTGSLETLADIVERQRRIQKGFKSSDPFEFWRLSLALNGRQEPIGGTS